MQRDMEVGDLVKCIWQPGTSHIENDRAVPLNITIKGEVGIIVRQDDELNIVFFPQFAHEQHLASRVLEIISESR
tara:strand:- start:133 stop:357 length:225 start_codon:yes stop_codon:yes gene_type:complete